METLGGEETRRRLRRGDGAGSRRRRAIGTWAGCGAALAGRDAVRPRRLDRWLDRWLGCSPGRWLVVALVALVALSGPAPGAEVATITQETLVERVEAKDPTLVVLDVRTAEEFSAGHVPGARNVPHDQIESRLAELAPLQSSEVVVYCRSGRRAGIAIDVLQGHGFTRVRHLEGDMQAWAEGGRPVEKAPPPLARPSPSPRG
jgi:phage shock protein E